MNEPQALIDLCANCPRDDCSGNKCSAYRDKARQLRQQSRSRYHAKEPVPDQPAACGVETLRLVNRAIDALEALLADPAADPFLTGRGVAGKLLEHMRRVRFNRCQHMIDWDLLIQNAKEDKPSE